MSLVCPFAVISTIVKSDFGVLVWNPNLQLYNMSRGNTCFRSYNELTNELGK